MSTIGEESLATSTNSNSILDEALWDVDVFKSATTAEKTSLIAELFKPSEQSASTPEKFERFFSIYAKECYQQFYEEQQLELPLSTHRDIIDVITHLFNHLEAPRKDVRESIMRKVKVFTKEENQEKNIIHFTIAFCLRVWLMMEVRDDTDYTVVPGTTKSSWDDDDVSLRGFIDHTLNPKPDLARASPTAVPISKFLTASNLEKTKELSVKILRTDNLSDHLKYDKKKHELNIFPHTAFLYAHSHGEFSGVLKKDFLEETLRTLALLYPEDQASAQKGNIERILDYNILSEMRDTSIKVISSYAYYGARLEQLNEAVESSTLIYTANKPVKVPVFEKLVNVQMLEKRPFRRQKHEEKRPDPTQSDNTFSNHKKFQIEGPPKPMTLARTVNSWSPAILKWGHHSSLRRHKQLCPRHEASVKKQLLDPYGYLLVAIFDSHSTAQEKCIYFKREDISEQDLFGEIKKSYEELYGWRRYVSLKSLSGFNLFSCEGQNFETHSRPLASSLNHDAHTALAQLFKVYQRKKTWLGPTPNVRTAWARWIDKNLNGLSNDPRDGRGLGLELVIGWSGKRIVVLTLVLVILSLLFGLIYGPLMDDIQTAWTIASYIITATGVLAAILAILWREDSSGAKEPRQILEATHHDSDSENASLLQPNTISQDSTALASLTQAIQELSRTVDTLQQSQRLQSRPQAAEPTEEIALDIGPSTENV